jgi:ribonuclease P protein subunit RPR2
MGKTKAEKAQKKGDGIQQRHVHSRISFLHQAATYLSGAAKQNTHHATTISTTRHQHNAPQSRQFMAQLKEISQKTQIRVTPEMKRSICKRCQSLLVAGSTSEERIANASRSESKPWADVFEIRCKTCGTRKRFPIGQNRKKVKKRRERTESRLEEKLQDD